MLQYILKPVLADLGYAEPRRSDTMSEPGVITTQIIRELLSADLAIIDMTGRNPNVFYELAIRHCIGKPFIQLMSKGEVIPFDVGTQRTIFYDRTDLADVEMCKAELKKQIQATRAPGFEVESPVGKAMNFERLAQATPTELVLHSVLDRINYVAKLVEEGQPDESRHSKTLRLPELTPEQSAELRKIMTSLCEQVPDLNLVSDLKEVLVDGDDAVHIAYRLNEFMSATDESDLQNNALDFFVHLCSCDIIENAMLRRIIKSLP